MKTDVFTCPFCCMDVPHQAVVCGHCARDFGGLKPLILELNRHTEEIIFQKTIVVNLTEDLEALKTLLVKSESYMEEKSGIQEPTQVNLKSKIVKYLLFFGAIFLCLISLVFAHWLLIFVYDVKSIVLRLVTLSIPLIFGIWSINFSRVNCFANFLASIFLGICSVTCMLFVTSLIDDVPFFPSSARDWREAAEYALSISAGFFTGYWIENWRNVRHNRTRLKINLSPLLKKDSNGLFKINHNQDKIESFAAAIAPFLSAGTAIYSGLKIFLG